MVFNIGKGVFAANGGRVLSQQLSKRCHLSCQACSGQGEAGQVWAAGPPAAGQVWAGQDRCGQGRAGRDRCGQGAELRNDCRLKALKALR